MKCDIKENNIVPDIIIKNDKTNVKYKDNVYEIETIQPRKYINIIFIFFFISVCINI